MTTGPATAAAALQRALELHRAGRLGEADAIYRDVLAAEPGHADALHLSGLIAHQTGDQPAALARIDAAIAANGRVGEYHANRGVVLLRLGRAAEAETAFRRALQLKPQYADAHNGLGSALQALGRLDEAVASYRHALLQRPDLAEARNNLGNALRRLNQPDAAIAAFRQALAQRPDYLAALCNLAAALRDRGDLADAAASYRDALARAPQHAPAWHGLAGVQRELGDFAAALASHRHAAAADPDNRRYRLDLGDCLADLNHTDAAHSCFTDILTRWPATTDAHVGLARLAHNAGDDAAACAGYGAALAAEPDCVDALRGLADLEGEIDAALRPRIQRLADDPERPLRQRSRLHFALARLCDRTSADDEAFAHYRHANALRRRDLEQSGVRFEAVAHAAFVDAQIAACTPDFFSRAAALGDATALPIFIVGMPRSGTTLCEQILASHPQVHALGEQLDIQTMARQLPARIGGDLPYPACLAGLTPATAQAMVGAYLARLRGLAPQAARITDKHPTNFRHLGLIAALMPRARLIHCRRDPMDTCVSCFTQDFEAPIPWASDLATLGQYYRQYDRLMRHWQRVLPVPVHVFDYKSTIDDLEGTARRLIEFCGLPWDERCLRFHETARPVLTASARQVRRPLYASAIGKWRRYARHLEPLRAALGDLAVASER